MKTTLSTPFPQTPTSTAAHIMPSTLIHSKPQPNPQKTAHLTHVTLPNPQPPNSSRRALPKVSPLLTPEQPLDDDFKWLQTPILETFDSFLGCDLSMPRLTPQISLIFKAQQSIEIAAPAPKYLQPKLAHSSSTAPAEGGKSTTGSHDSELNIEKWPVPELVTDIQPITANGAHFVDDKKSMLSGALNLESFGSFDFDLHRLAKQQSSFSFNLNESSNIFEM